VLASLFRRAGFLDVEPEQLRLLAYGRVVDTSAVTAELGWSPRQGTVEAFDAFVRGRGLSTVLGADAVAGAERAVLDLLGVRRTAGA